MQLSPTPTQQSLVPSTQLYQKVALTFSTAHDAEAVEAMEKSGAKDDMGTLRSYDDEDGGGGFAATSAAGTGTNLAPVGAGWIVAVAKSDLLAAAKEIEAGASASDVTLVAVGGPAASAGCACPGSSILAQQRQGLIGGCEGENRGNSE
jgi:hypothetical protein